MGKIIKKSQEEYYKVLSQCDQEGLSTKFVEYLLGKIKLSLAELVDMSREYFTHTERLSYFLEQINIDVRLFSTTTGQILSPMPHRYGSISDMKT
jgi:Fic family protein